MKTPNLQKQSGFTLVELLIASVLTIFLASGTILIHLSGRQASIDAEQLSRMQENIRFASDYVVRDIRNAAYRDEAFLRWGHEEQIREKYASILSSGVDADSGDTLRVRYAGRGHCTEAFDEFRLVENEYFLNANTGELSCRGRSIDQNDAITASIEDVAFGNPIGLVRGVTNIQFDKISVNDQACAFDLKLLQTDPDLNPTTLCTGVSFTMRLRGMQSIDTAGVDNERVAVLTAAFRNVILTLVNTNAYASE